MIPRFTIATIPHNVHDTYSYCLEYFEKALSLCKSSASAREDYKFKTRPLSTGRGLEGKFILKTRLNKTE